MALCNMLDCSLIADYLSRRSEKILFYLRQQAKAVAEE